MARICPRGQILRRSYVKKSGIKVQAACIKDLGRKGKGKKLFTLRKGVLSPYGYSVKKNAISRHRALSMAMKKKPMTYSEVVKRLNALYVLNKNTNPQYAARYRSDMKWIQKTYSK